MISLTHLIANPDLYKLDMQKRNKDFTVIDRIIQVNSMLKPVLIELENLRASKNKFNETVLKLSGKEKINQISQMKIISGNIGELEQKARELKELQENLIYQVPNLTWGGIPIGPDSGGNVVTKYYNKKPEFTFPVIPYYDLPLFKRDYLSQKGVQAAGFRGYYMVGNLARLHNVVFRWTMDRLMEKGFEFVIPPIMVKEDLLYGTGFFPDGKEDCFSAINGEKELFLPGTSEAALMFLYSDTKLNLTEPKKLTAQTRCFRGEIGSYGKDTKGGFRVHEFEKIETVYLCRPNDTETVFDEMTDNFRETMDLLGLHYWALEVCSGDISVKNKRQIDIEAYFPGLQEYREVCSSSICTDYQTRNLNIKTVDENGLETLAYSLNCTGMVGRVVLCILEQFQNADGTVTIPTCLQTMFGSDILD